MIEIVLKYWLNFLLGLISGGLVLLCKKLWKLYQDERQHQKTKAQESFQKEITEAIGECIQESKRGDEALQKQIDILKEGILSIQKAHFKKRCKELLKEGHEITMEEFESIVDDHSAYNALGGNHDGDMLFEMVKRKADKCLSD